MQLDSHFIRQSFFIAISNFRMIHQELLGLFVIIISIEAFNKILEKNVYRFKPIVCRTDDCKTMAKVILSTMNRTADPCDDFYEYACGAWIHSNESLPFNEATWNRMAMFNKELSQKLRMILESDNIDAIPVEKAKHWYRTCMDEEALEQCGIEPLTSIVTAVGGWPIAMALGEWNPTDYSWQEIELYYSRITGSYAMYDLVINMNKDNASMNEISLIAPSLPLSEVLQLQRKFFDPQDRVPYGQLIARVARAFATAQGARVSDEKITKEVDDMIEFEIELDKFKDDDASATYNISRMQQLLDQQMPISEITSINLLKLIQNLVEGIGEIKITEEETITVEALYLIELGALLNKTSFRTIVNYVHWHYLSRMLHLTNSEMRNFFLEFMKQTLGIRQLSPRWEQCVLQMEMNHALSYQFVLEHFTDDTYSLASQMIAKIQIELEREINGSTWMDDETKELLRDKLWNVKAFVGFPDWYKKVTNLEEYYEGLTISDNYFANVLNYMRFKKKKMFQNLRVQDGQPEWLSDPITVNAFYIMNANSMNIPAADFQPPLFTPMMPEAVKYGIIGTILGHELSHGFDDTGCHFDKNGEIIDWPDEMMIAYWQRARCFIDQYDNLTNLNTIEKFFYGSQTVGENIADSMGVQSVLNAYKSVVKESLKGDRKLPGLEDLSNEQLFLLSFATIWCEMSTPQFARKKLLSSDPHSSSRVRTLASMSNIVGFAEAFNCPEGSPMNPLNKCNIWNGAPLP